MEISVSFLMMILFEFVDGAMNEGMKQNIRGKVESYLNRAEEIKNNSKNPSNKKKAVVEGGNSKDNKDDEDSGDPERKRMMAKFEGQAFAFVEKNLMSELKF